MMRPWQRKNRTLCVPQRVRYPAGVGCTCSRTLLRAGYKCSPHPIDEEKIAGELVVDAAHASRIWIREAMLSCGTRCGSALFALPSGVACLTVQPRLPGLARFTLLTHIS